MLELLISRLDFYGEELKKNDYNTRPFCMERIKLIEDFLMQNSPQKLKAIEDAVGELYLLGGFTDKKLDKS